MKQKTCLLLADDSTLVRNNLKRLLGDQEDLEIFEARDYDDACRMLKRHEPDIILLDLRMPGGNGLDVIDFINTMPKKPVIIVLSNIATEESRNKCISKGADYFFDKTREHRNAIELIRKLSEEIPEEMPE